jgi:asparagine synthase (glutamine-hydrolysing)
VCGIAGFVHEDATRAASAKTLVAMRDTLEHRGPDDAGCYFAPGVGLASRRLAILDLSARGHMPMTSHDGRYRIVYNGEVYNYRELRAELQARGQCFRSDTDTEVVLALYATYGPAMLERLDGMFAIAIWDTLERRLFLARDHVGIKPLYYARHDRTLYFGSEEKALFAAGVPAQFDADTWEEMLCFRYVAGEATGFERIRRLLPGHYLTWQEGRMRIVRWWNLAERARARREQLPARPQEWFRDVFDASVRRRLISDVPVGLLLSGGLDSSSVAASLALQADSKIASFTVRFDEHGFDEGPLAADVARRWNLDYHELVVAPADVARRLEHATLLQDEPMAHSNHVHLLAISEYAKPRVTVLLSGEGGDEVLGGYVRYWPLRFPRLLRAARPLPASLAAPFGAKERIAKLNRFLGLGNLDRFVLYNACNVLPHELGDIGFRHAEQFTYREHVLREARALYPGEPLRQAMYSDQHTFLCSLLDRNDRMTMGASIECRVPFLSMELLEVAAALPSAQLLAGRGNKPLLRRALGHRLPRSVLGYRKWGFGVPWGTYMRDVAPLRELVSQLPETEPVRSGPFDRGRLARAIDGFLGGSSASQSLILQLLLVTTWYRACCSPPAPARVLAAAGGS